METAVIVCTVLLVLATVGTLHRLARGPALLDRAIALDVLLAIVGAALAVEMAYNRHLDNLVLLVIVSLIGFLGSVTLARFTNPGK